MEVAPRSPQFPEGVDDEEYRRIRAYMRASVLNVWRVNVVIAGMDPWDVVDEAWTSMAKDDFRCKGPFLPHALAVARNKAIDHLRRAEARRRDRSIDAPLSAGEDAGGSLQDEIAGSAGADDDYFRDQERVAAVQRLALVEQALYESDILTKVERRVFIAVRVEGKSRAAVGRELDPPLTGQRVGQLVAQALIKLQSHVKQLETAQGGGSGA